jgi:hypothetical protein
LLIGLTFDNFEILHIISSYLTLFTVSAHNQTFFFQVNIRSTFSLEKISLLMISSNFRNIASGYYSISPLPTFDFYLFPRFLFFFSQITLLIFDETKIILHPFSTTFVSSPILSFPAQFS